MKRFESGVVADFAGEEHDDVMLNEKTDSSPEVKNAAKIAGRING